MLKGNVCSIGWSGSLHRLPSRDVQSVNRQRLFIRMHRLLNRDLQSIDRQQLFIVMHRLPSGDIQSMGSSSRLHRLPSRDVQSVERQQLFIRLHRLPSRDVQSVDRQQLFILMQCLPSRNVHCDWSRCMHRLPAGLLQCLDGSVQQRIMSCMRCGQLQRRHGNGVVRALRYGHLQPQHRQQL